MEYMEFMDGEQYDIIEDLLDSEVENDSIKVKPKLFSDGMMDQLKKDNEAMTKQMDQLKEGNEAVTKQMHQIKQDKDAVTNQGNRGKKIDLQRKMKVRTDAMIDDRNRSFSKRTAGVNEKWSVAKITLQKKDKPIKKRKKKPCIQEDGMKKEGMGECQPGEKMEVEEDELERTKRNIKICQVDCQVT